ncbi:NAD(P)H-dependent oxidoreductase [Nocardia ninae]|uniref:NAD(P)H-dependent oxidoreductase n=1 Tax=Nocardia ninae TaxID=356145 RepID=UPI0011BD95B2|nr:NAD(P)H-dependent oxidoreductase [Nocardia ninae]
MTNERSQPKVLLVVSHPDHESATWAIAHAVEQGIQADGSTMVAVHDLTASGFDPVFRPADLAVHRLLGEVPADVRREQELIESADVVALLFPVYWWSMPALAKGWIDRVFSRGWAYENTSPDGPSAVKELHFIALAGINQGTFDRRGYKDAITLQLEHGIAGYSEIDESSVEVLYGTETTDPQAHEELAAQGYKLGSDLAQRAQAAFDRKVAVG